MTSCLPDERFPKFPFFEFQKELFETKSSPYVDGSNTHKPNLTPFRLKEVVQFLVNTNWCAPSLGERGLSKLKLRKRNDRKDERITAGNAKTTEMVENYVDPQSRKGDATWSIQNYINRSYVD